MKATALMSSAVLSFALFGCMSLEEQPTSPANEASSAALLTTVVASRDEQQRTRDRYRNPKQTLQFFGIEPGMTVVEVLPGRGWYSQILAPYLAEGGTLHAVNYADTMWDMFGFMSPTFIAERKAQMQNWATHVDNFGGNASSAQGFAFDAVPESLNGQVDAVLMIRALHNLNRFEASAQTRSKALADVYRVLKPGGIVGVVQHRAPVDAPDDWAAGQNGYLKQQAVVDMFEQQGFELVGSSEINANAKDVPTEDDYVWRLPPSRRGAGDDPAALAKVNAIGESDRMTLKFIKPE